MPNRKSSKLKPTAMFSTISINRFMSCVAQAQKESSATHLPVDYTSGKKTWLIT